MFLQAGRAYRSIAQFAKHVTQRTAYLGNFPFPELYKEVASEENICDSDSELAKITRSKSKPKSSPTWFRKKPKDKPSKEPIVEKGNEEDLTASVVRGPVFPPSDNVAADEGVDTCVRESDKEEGTSSVPQVRARCKCVLNDFLTTPQKKSDVIMLRERVDIRGQIRPMESVEEIPALHIPPSQIGLIKEAPVRRWLRGQAMWDEQFKRRSKKVLEKRMKLEEKAERILRHVTQQGLVVKTEAGEVPASLEQAGRGGGGERDEVRLVEEPQGRRKSNRSMSTTMGVIDENRRFGPLDLDDENPPPSAIAKRRDTVSQIIASVVSCSID